MNEPSEPARRRRRRRASAPQGPARPAAAVPVPVPSEPRPDAARRGGKRRRAGQEPGEGGLHDLVGSGRSALGVDGALRARDVNRPSEQDLADAEREVVLVHRHWRPPDKHS